MMDDFFFPLIICAMLFIGLPWMIFHYITKWKSKATLTREDEDLHDTLHDLARRCDDRLMTVERIMTAENPGWRQVACDPAAIGIEDKTQETNRRIA